MFTPLENTNLHDLLEKPVLFDANIFMVGIEDRVSDKNCSFENMKSLYLQPIIESFKSIYIHEEVYKELDDESRTFIDDYLNKNVKIVYEGDLYGKDPKYTTIYNNISKHELANYERGRSKNKGEIYSLAYAAYHNINYFCTKDVMPEIIANELDELKGVDTITFDVVVLLAYIYHAEQGDKTKNKALKSIYKRYCDDVIRRHKLPHTLREYIIEVQDYL